MKWLLRKLQPLALAPYEVYFMRALFAILLWQRGFLEKSKLYTSQDTPNGITNFVDLTFLGDPGVYGVFYTIALVALVLYVIGIAPVVTLPFLAVFNIACHTLTNSQGGITHSNQMVSLILLAQAIFAVWAFFSKKSASRWHWRQSLSDDRLAIFYSQIVVVGCYMVAGLKKLDNSNMLWLWNSPYLGDEAAKSWRMGYYNKLDAEQFGGQAPLAEWLIENPWLARIFLAPGLLFELGAVLALLGRMPALAVGLALIAMHRGIMAIMGLNFDLFEYCIIIFLINVPFWAVKACSRWKEEGKLNASQGQ
jgi:hypothetical protein